MSLRPSILRLLAESRDYPALLSRLVAIESELSSVDVLRDVLEPDMCGIQDLDERHQRLCERGELGAAQGLRGDSRDLVGLVGAKAKLHQDIDLLLRQLRGRLLILRDSPSGEVKEINARIEVLATDAYLRDFRPGRLLQFLRELDDRLDTLIEQARDQQRREIEELRASPHSADDRDFKIALQRIDQLPSGPETLPTAQRLLTLARRAQDGQLSPEDLRQLHQQGSQRGRLIRPRSDFPQIRNVTDALDVLERGGVLRFPSEAEREQTIRVFRALLPSAPGGWLKTITAIRELGKFLGFRQDDNPAHRSEIGSSFRLSVPSPRVPAFRDGEDYYAKGIQFVIPITENRVQDLLRELPQDSLRVVLVNGRQDGGLRSPYGASDLVYLDLVDLLRLGECPLDQRLHAWQQILLPRLPLRRLKPYQGGGPVSPEMFRGRTEVIERLRRPKGGTVLFSGRMMGKSSILTRIQSTIEARRAMGQTNDAAVFVSVAADDELLTPLCSRLTTLLGEIDSRRSRDAESDSVPQAQLRPDVRRERARRRLARLRDLIAAALRRFTRLTILVDEADKFAAADAERTREESVAWTLRDLEFEQPERLRVIFAGFQTIHHQVLFKNGAFAHWFGLTELGALEQPDAESLVVEPFADFGFVFSSQAATDRILEFTGRHPLLIQEVCSRLMDRVEARRRPDGGDEVVPIQAGDVETVCRDDQLRDRLRQVLSLNLEEYPRLKLMVYLLVFATNTPGRSLTLEQFRLDDLTEILIEFYERRFNDYFDKRSISALLQELIGVGLVSRRGDSYEFVNRTYAAMLREDRSFDTELERLLVQVTNPDRSETRRFYTLPNEELERVLRLNRGHALVFGLPQSARSFIAQRLFQQDEGGIKSEAYLMSAAGNSDLAGFLGALKVRFGEKRKTLTVADLLVMHGIGTLVLDEADSLCGNSNELGALLEQLTEREIHLVAFGGAPLARCYVTDLLARFDIQPVSLRRLRAQDIRAWGEHSGTRDADEFQVTFDRQTSEQLARVTGGYMALLHGFRRFIRNGPQHRASDFVPTLKEVDEYAREKVNNQAIEHMLAPLRSEERALLAELYKFAVREQAWDIEWEFVEDDVFESLRRRLGGGLGDWLERLEVLRLLDLIEDRPVDGQRRILIASGGPLSKVF